MIEAGGQALYFAGDIAPGNPFREIGGRFTLDLALLPIGACRPLWIMRLAHQDPHEALDAFRALGASS